MSSAFNKKAKGSRDLGLSFARTFPFNRQEIADLLKSLVDGDDVRQTLATNVKIPAAKGYCKRAGLVTSSYELTSFGEQAILRDPDFVRPETLWLAHYYLSTPHYSDPNFWSDLVINKLAIGITVTTSDLKDRIAEFANQANGSQPSTDTLDSAATSFISTYSRIVGLYGLSLFPTIQDSTGQVAEQSGQYKMSTPAPIPTAAFACILADYWQAKFPNSTSIDEEKLTGGDGEPGELARILLLSKADFNAHLGALAAPDVGHIQRQRRFSPAQIQRRWTDQAKLWAALYD